VAAKWSGRCTGCGAWNTLEERPDGQAGVCPAIPVELASVPQGGATPMPSGVGELDRVLGGGIVPSSVTLLAGEPGIGKSTLLLQMLASLADSGARSLLVSAEESPEQVRERADRLGALRPEVWIVAATELGEIRSAARRVQPDVLVVDSVQTVADGESGGAPGTVSQVRACAQALADDAKRGGPAVVLAGHVTKDGSIAGPRVLEHLVDTVLTFEGDRHHGLRLLRAVKHRFGAAGELGLLEMTESGLVEVLDGGAFLLADRRPASPGSVVFAAMDGRRPLLVEIQALVGPAAGPPRRSASGYDTPRLCQLLAVLDRRVGLRMASQDVYVSAAGGVSVAEPAADLAVALAVASAATGRVVPDGMVAIAEVGLGGELRRAVRMQARLAEAARHGFGTAVVATGEAPAGQVRLRSAATLGAAIDACLGEAVEPPRLRVLSVG
jgi:DNA repair protein RadA/Sms